LQAKLSLTHLDIEEIDRRLRVERHDTRKKAACNMKADLIRGDRCPKCTLKPPCKHYENAVHFFTRKTVLLSQEDWLLMDQDNRDGLIQLKRNGMQGEIRSSELRVRKQKLDHLRRMREKSDGRSK
jgi:hypothetical protein